MNAEDLKIAKRILDALHALDGGQAHGMTIHAEIGGLNVCTTSQFNDVLAELDRSKWVIGVKTKFRGVMWNISDAGEAARLEM